MDPYRPSLSDKGGYKSTVRFIPNFERDDRIRNLKELQRKINKIKG